MEENIWFACQFQHVGSKVSPDGSHLEIFQNKGKYLSSVAGCCFESVNIKQTDVEYF